MLERLAIENYATIESLHLEFAAGFHAFTGETGAGKSVILGSLSQLFGDKDAGALRPGTDRMLIEAEFSVQQKDCLQELAQIGIHGAETSLILRKEVSAQGKSRAFINGSQEPLQKLHALGQWLLDMHGQHDHQLLLQVKQHLEILDSYAGLKDEVAHFAQRFSHLSALRTETAELQDHMDRMDKEKLYLENAIQEIGQLKRNASDWDQLPSQIQRLSQSEDIYESFEQLQGTLPQESFARALRKLESLAAVDPKYAELAHILRDVESTLNEASRLAREYQEEAQGNPALLDALIAQESQLKHLLAKYRKSHVNELWEFQAECEQTLTAWSTHEDKLATLQAAIQTLEQQLRESALALSQKRQKAAQTLSQAIHEKLQYLGLEQAVFQVKIHYVVDDASWIRHGDQGARVSPEGLDRAEYLFSANPGLPPQPLRKVASGGEMSRLMLAIKSVLAAKDRVETLIFDEIDSGVGGMLAHRVGAQMRDLAQSRQLFSITHLAQIAACAEHHYSVEKIQQNHQTLTRVRKLSHEERVVEIARMQGGDSQTAHALAKELLRLK